MHFAVALFAGLLLFASDQPLGLWPLQFVAFVPLWLALAARRTAGRTLWPLGTLFGAGYVLPMLLVAGAAPPILVAAATVLAEWTILAMVVGRLLGRAPVRGALAAAAAVALGELAIWYGVPMFGTGQCFVRPLSAAPALVAFIAFTGVAGLVFVTTALQALLANALLARRATPVVVAAAIVLVITVLDVVRWQRPLPQPITVAAFGWDDEPPGENLTEMFGPAFAAASAAGAQLLVTPETGLFVDLQRRELLLVEVGKLARQSRLAAAIGVWARATYDNRIWFFLSDGAFCAEYRKSHLIPWLENYTAGDGTLAAARVGERTLGGMICQDDNFTDIARGYGRLGTALVAVPTNDWPEIRVLHLQNGIFRAIENGYAIVRAASRGISAIVSPRGEVLAREDHTGLGPKLVVGDVAPGDGGITLYARYGDWPVAGLCALLLVLALWRPRG